MTPLFIQNMGVPGILLICVVALVLFGRGKISNMMGEVGRGITAFKKGVNDASSEGAEAIEVAADAAKDVTPKKKAAKKTAPKTAKKPAKKTTKKS